MAPSRSKRRAASCAALLVLAAPALAQDARIRGSAPEVGTPGATSSAPAFVPPPQLHYSHAHSFRGVQEGGKVEGFSISGHSTGVPGVHDYLRLVPPNSLTHGALFADAPLAATEWIVELAFRVHGPVISNLVDSDEDAHHREPKGGRGLAFWISKTKNPTPTTISFDPEAVLSPPPAFLPSHPDPTDAHVSLFGYETTFDGLGVVFDTTPTAPLHHRSDPKSLFGLNTPSAGSSGVVSGILDDGKTGGWIEPKKRVMQNGEEAHYLERAVGECEAAFRNAQGLLWARISYIDKTIRVDLDLSPHTTLSKAGRDYAHNCFRLEGIKLDAGSYIGVTGLAGGNAEPDSIDVYALDVFEVVPETPGEAPHAPIVTEEPVEEIQKQPLEGTSDDASMGLAHEIFLSQAKIVEAIDALARRVEELSRTVTTNRFAMAGVAAPAGGKAASPPSASSSDPLLNSRLATIEVRLEELIAKASAPGAGGGDAADGETVKHILQLQDRLMVELKAFGNKVVAANSQSTASLATLSTRSGESLQLLQKVATGIETVVAKGMGWPFWTVVSFVAGISLLKAVRGGREDGLLPGWGRGRDKKMF